VPVSAIPSPIRLHLLGENKHRSANSLPGGAKPALSVQEIDPFQDVRWDHFVSERQDASVFHCSAWLKALKHTYGYEPSVLTTCKPGRDLTNGLVFCRIKSWLTGRRLVSLPFSDHCKLLADAPEDVDRLLTSLQTISVHENCSYVEVRSPSADPPAQFGYGKTKKFCLHEIDLRPGLDELFHSFHKNCVQRKIRRAEREGLVCEDGRSERLLQQFYHLLLLTRRRHRLPPQPLNWFRNLIRFFGERITISVASKEGRAVASLLTLCYKDTLVYKYGCSDARFNLWGGMPLLFWKAIQKAKENGLREFDLGRTDLDDAGLLAFKDRWGGRRSILAYWRYPAPDPEKTQSAWAMRVARQMITYMPNSLLPAAGKLIYRHVG
jgi:hypothetical protein